MPETVETQESAAAPPVKWPGQMVQPSAPAAPPTPAPAAPTATTPDDAIETITVTPKGTPAQGKSWPGKMVAAAPPATENKPPPTAPMGDALNPQAAREAITNAYTAARQKASAALAHARGREADVDYGPGIGFETELALKQADNPQEAKLALEMLHGEGSAGQDKAGNWWVKQDGKKVAVFGDHSTFRKRAATSIMSEAPAMAGMTAGEAIGGAIGGALGAPAGPAAFAAAGAGATVGGVLGRGAQEFWKWHKGTSAKTAKEEREVLTDTAIAGAGAFGLGRALGAAGRYAINPSSLPWVDIPADKKEFVAQALKRDIVPTVAQATGARAFRIFMADQKLAMFLWSNPRIAKNVQALNDQFVGALRGAGVPDDQIDATLERILKRDVSTADMDSRLVQAVQDYHDGLQEQFVQRSEIAQRELSKQFAAINREVASPGIGLGDRVRADITAAREKLSADAGAMATAIDDMAGGRELVDTAPIKDQVREIYESLPKDAGTPAKQVRERDPNTGTWHVKQEPGEAPRALGTQVETPTSAYIRDMLRLPDQITLAWATRIRSTLLDLTRDQNLTPGIGWKELRQVEGSVEAALENTAANVDDKPTIEALRTFQRFYRENITRFKDILANRLVKEAGQGGVEPEKVMQTIVSQGKVSQARRIMGLLQPDTQQQLSRDYFDDIVKRTTNQIAHSVEPMINGARLAAVIEKEGPMMGVVLGKDVAARLKELATNLRSFDGELPVSVIGSIEPGAAITGARAARAQLDGWLEGNYLSAMTKPGFQRDAAFDYVIRHGGGPASGRIERLRTAMRQFGPDSPIMNDLRQRLMSKLLQSSVGLSSDPTEQMFTGLALKNELAAYGRDYLTEAFGKDMSDNLFHLGDVVAGMTGEPKGSGMAIGFVAGTHILLAPLTHLSTLAGHLVLNKLMMTPGFIRWLILGLNGDNAAVKVLNQMTRRAVDLAAQSTPPFNQSNTQRLPAQP